jgi:signal transduction histidine kinase
VPDRKAYLGVAIVAGAVLVSAVIGVRGAIFTIGVLGPLANGLFVAVAAFALVAYARGRDPGLLLVGIGAAAAAANAAAVSALFVLTGPPFGPGRIALISYAPLAGLVALVGTLAVVLPWRERRGRPPMDPWRVAGVVTAGLVLFDVVCATTNTGASLTAIGPGASLGFLGWLEVVALLAGGVVIAVRSLPKGGRQGWIAAAGISLAIVGFTIAVSAIGDATGPRMIVQTWAGIAPTLAAGSLLMFVIVSLRLEASRQRRATDRAAEVMEGRAEIAATIAHDVRGPVGTIKGLATTTRSSYARLDDAERLEFVGMIEQESARLLRLVDQVALALKVVAGTLEMTLRRQSLAPLVRQALEQTDPAGHRIEVHADPAIEGAADTRWFVEALRQGLDNAVGFSPQGSEVTVTITTGEDGPVVAIVDRGPGVPPEMREAVFEKFARWRPEGYGERQGSGLGLFIARGIARMHGGEATLAEAAEGGTMLRIQLPREEMGK